MDLQLTADAVFLTSAQNIRYLTGFSGLSPTEREAYLLITNDQWHLCTFQLYATEAQAVAKIHPHIQVHYITPDTRLSSLLSSIYKETGMQTMEFEQQSITYREYTELSKALPGVVFSANNGTIEALRVKKSAHELVLLQQATKLTDECFRFIQTRIQDGITESELAWDIERYIREHDAHISFDPIVAFNEHTSAPHHVSASTPLGKRSQQSSIILMDFGAKISGYHADMTRVLFYGNPEQEWINAYTILKTAQERVIEYLSTNASGSKADALARDIITSAGYPTYPHSLGHGVGLEIHENPRLSVHKEYILEEGMVFSIEPGIYIEEKFGMRLEDLAVKTKQGITLLSTSTREAIIL